MIDGYGAQTMAEAAPKSWTYEDLLAAGLDPRHYDIVDGEPVRAEKAVSLEGGWIWTRLGGLVGEHVRANRLGVVFTHGRFLVQEDPRIERRPDLAFVGGERLPPRPFPDLFPGAPDLAIEVLSPSDPMTIAGRRARQYLAKETREVWLLEPEVQTITVLRPEGHPRSYSYDDSLDTPDLLPGFTLVLADLFSQ